MFAPGWRKMASITKADYCEAEVASVFDRIFDLRNIPQTHRGADMSGNNQRLIFVSFEKLIGIGDGRHSGGIGYRALGQIGIRHLQGTPDGFQLMP